MATAIATAAADAMRIKVRWCITLISLQIDVALLAQTKSMQCGIPNIALTALNTASRPWFRMVGNGLPLGRGQA